MRAWTYTFCLSKTTEHGGLFKSVNDPARISDIGIIYLHLYIIKNIPSIFYNEY